MIATEIKLNQILCGKSEEKLKDFPDNFFDAIVTDPPYELNFMGKAWDSSGIAYNVEFWKEVLRVAKPGAHLLCFGGTRTHHRVACAIEDAGWLIRDEIDWIYGSGFPKSSNISKQIDKQAGVEREVIGFQKGSRGAEGTGYENSVPQTAGIPKVIIDIPVTAPATELAKQWDGYGTTLKPAREPIIVAMKPLEEGLTFAQNAEKWGVAGLNIDGGRIKTDEEWSFNVKDKNTIGQPIKTNPDHTWNYKVRDAFHSHPQGRWPSNIILSHSPDCVYVEEKIINEGAPEGGYTYSDREYKVEGFVPDCKPQAPSNYGQETMEVWACVPDCPVRMIDEQSGMLVSRKPRVQLSKGAYTKTNLVYGHGKGEKHLSFSPGDSGGGASRFFYCAKPSRAEKDAGLKDFMECIICGEFSTETHIIFDNGKKMKGNCIRNDHVTVKPLDLMRYLITLVKMPNENQVLLDPFCGSGSTLIAAEQLGLKYIGIDQDMDNVLIATARSREIETIENICNEKIKRKEISDEEAFDDFSLSENLSSSDFEDLI